MTTVVDVEVEQTPDEWLLQRYEEDETISRFNRASVGHVRPMFEVLDDHRGAECNPNPQNCARWSGKAAWPEPLPSNNLLVWSSSNSELFQFLMHQEDE